MTTQRREPEEEMLIVHPRPVTPAADPASTGSTPAALDSALAARDLEALARRATLSADPAEKRRILAAVQRRFGNERARALARELRGSDARSSAPPQPEPDREKGKA